MSADPLFQLSDVSYSYGSVSALDRVSFRVDAGEQVVLLGANGSGKSTLLLLMDGLIFPSTGSVHVFDRPLTEEALEGDDFCRFFRSSVALVFQNADAQLFNPTVEDELAFGPLQLGLPEKEIRERVDSLTSMLGLEEMLKRSPHTLSGGEKRKVAIAAALSTNPSVLLLDEPTTGLDPRSQVWLAETLVQLRKAGKTIITATHDLSIVEDIADRAIVISEDHRLAADGAANDILSNRELLLSVNLIHEHAHRHGQMVHVHSHSHISDHEHDHGHP
ncbi:MAG: ATP-binding cassette domain-containing protein [Nitrospirota bacterium]|nr:ATP-binding cassette domain-containing protein [Nitrospirota bacterium]